MSRRPSDVSTATVPLSVRERLILDDLKVKAALATDANIVRLALWKLARHYDMDMAASAFELRGPAGSKPTRVRPSMGDRT